MENPSVSCQVPSFRRLKYVVFDANSLDGMDASGAMSMLKLTRKVRALRRALE